MTDDPYDFVLDPNGPIMRGAVANIDELREVTLIVKTRRADADADAVANGAEVADANRLVVVRCDRPMKGGKRCRELLAQVFKIGDSVLFESKLVTRQGDSLWPTRPEFDQERRLTDLDDEVLADQQGFVELRYGYGANATATPRNPPHSRDGSAASVIGPKQTLVFREVLEPEPTLFADRAMNLWVRCYHHPFAANPTEQVRMGGASTLSRELLMEHVREARLTKSCVDYDWSRHEHSLR